MPTEGIGRYWRPAAKSLTRHAIPFVERNLVRCQQSVSSPSFPHCLSGIPPLFSHLMVHWFLFFSLKESGQVKYEGARTVLGDAVVGTKRDKSNRKRTFQNGVSFWEQVYPVRMDPPQVKPNARNYSNDLAT